MNALAIQKVLDKARLTRLKRPAKSTTQLVLRNLQLTPSYLVTKLAIIIIAIASGIYYSSRIYKAFIIAFL